MSHSMSRCGRCREFVQWREWARSEPSALSEFLSRLHMEHRTLAQAIVALPEPTLGLKGGVNRAAVLNLVSPITVQPTVPGPDVPRA